jgi:hypothetical protein
MLQILKSSVFILHKSLTQVNGVLVVILVSHVNSLTGQPNILVRSDN